MHIIDDQSPYYTRFSMPALDIILPWLQKNITNPQVCRDYPFTEGPQRDHHRKQIDLDEIWSHIPGKDIIPWSNTGTIFVTLPGGGSPLHRDRNVRGIDWDDNMGLNFPITVQDNCCQTRWVDDTVLKSYPDIEYSNMHTLRPVRHHYVERTGQVPTARAVSLGAHEVMLVNTAIWHSWHNNSPHTRIIMSLRVKENKKHWTFQRAQEAMFVN